MTSIFSSFAVVQANSSRHLRRVLQRSNVKVRLQNVNAPTHSHAVPASAAITCCACFKKFIISSMPTLDANCKQQGEGDAGSPKTSTTDSTDGAGAEHAEHAPQL